MIILSSFYWRHVLLRDYLRVSNKNGTFFEDIPSFWSCHYCYILIFEYVRCFCTMKELLLFLSNL